MSKVFEKYGLDNESARNPLCVTRALLEAEKRISELEAQLELDNHSIIEARNIIRAKDEQIEAKENENASLKSFRGWVLKALNADIENIRDGEYYSEVIQRKNWRNNDLESELKAKDEQIEALQKDRDFIKGKFDRAMDAARRTINRLNEEVADLSLKTFRRFNEEECWIYQGDDSDNLHSLVCPVVISAKDLMALQASKASVDPHVNPECDHNCSSKAHYDFVQCDGCGWVLQGRLANTGRYEKDDGRVWWPSRSHAEFFYKHGRYLSEQKAD